MSYQKHFDTEYNLLPPALKLSDGQLASIRKCLEASSKNGSESGNLYAMELLLSNAIKDCNGVQPSIDAVTKSMWSESVGLAAALPMDKPIYAELAQYDLITALGLVNLLIQTVRFRPFTPLEGTPDEWFEHGHSQGFQNKRWGSMFKETADGEAYWLERFRVSHPSVWCDEDRWSSYSRRGPVSFPFNQSAESEAIFYTDETMRQRVAADSETSRQFIVQRMLAVAAGQSSDVLVNVRTEETTPSFAAMVIDYTQQVWSYYTATMDELRYPFERHHAALSDLRWASEYDSDAGEPDSVMFEGVIEIPYELLNHIRRAISFIPVDVTFVDGQWVLPHAHLQGGQFKALPVYKTAADYSDWAETELVSVRWVDNLFRESAVYHVQANPLQTSVIAGDQSDWLWRTRDALGIPHPKREHAGLPELNTDNYTESADVEDVPEA